MSSQLSRWKRIVPLLATGVVLGLTGVLPATALHASTQRAIATRSCGSGGGSASRIVCIVMPAHGTFMLPIPGTQATLIGAGTPDRAGKPIMISRVNLICPHLGGLGIHISTPRSEGLLPPLRWSSGTLYARNRITGRCAPVASPALAAAPGTYQVVPAVAGRGGASFRPSGPGIVSMPKSGAEASDARSSGSILPVAPELLLIALVLLAAGPYGRRFLHLHMARGEDRNH